MYKTNNDFIESVTLDDFRPGSDIRLLAEKFGVDIAIRFARELGGLNLYIPMNSLRDAAARFVRENYKRYSIKELVLMTGVSERHIYEIIAERKDRLKHQNELFEKCDDSNSTYRQ